MTKPDEIKIAMKRIFEPNAPFWELNLNPITMLPIQEERWNQKTEGVPLQHASKNNLRHVNR